VIDDDKSTHVLAVSRRPVRRIVIRVLEGPDAGTELAVEGERRVAIGSSPDNELRLSDPTVSRYHLEVVPALGGIRVRDLGSLNGTFAGGIRIDAAEVPPATRLSLGASVIAIDDAGMATASADEAPRAIPGFVAESPAMRTVAAAIERLAGSAVSVLIEGETGTGKELVARAIHELGPRSAAPFVVVDCGSLPATLIATELFGHERGAFTSADRRHAGAFERASGGTLFLDEIGELPLEVQPALLGVLERRQFRRVGGSSEVAVDVRVLAATHRDLRAGANQGAFRPDLYFRLAVTRLVIPPLRERPEDVPALVQHFAEELSGPGAREPFDRHALASLARQHWAGNVRELRNLVESALAMGDLPSFEGPRPSTPPPSATSELRYRDARARAIHDFERAYLGALIADCGGNASEAARRAGMDRPYLLTLLKRHGLR
jgi:DNA-binding NtrC family response regulator